MTIMDEPYFASLFWISLAMTLQRIANRGLPMWGQLNMLALGDLADIDIDVC